ncbi:MAG: hypothetical protein NWE91_02315 [Candidatus Bathyarchaeota archaeon]|nr:hypothetical protein [Candidatus Bathyarchaeota archaeon]
MKLTSLALLIILFSSMFLIGTTTSISPRGVHDYDPWRDFDDDGDIDIYDIVDIAGRYGTTGTPVNKTALLYNVSDTFAELYAQLGELQSHVNDLQDKVEALENQSGWMVAPAFDSGWISINPDERYFFWHSLNTTNVLVYVIGKNGSGFIHQWRIGMDYDSYGIGSADYGLFWSRLDSNVISVLRGRSDTQWAQVKVMIWKISEP